jgi:hypothetical protein
MDITHAAIFLAGSILMSLGLVVIVVAAVVINNILSIYWKPVKIINPINYPPTRFATEEELEQIDPDYRKRK